jgi:Cof subfamily protein (haloacid dehalogenase superfamily)
MIRLIATDLDDTLLDASAALTARTRRALDAAMALGCGITLSSGRMLEAMLPFAEEIGVNAPMLLFNGAMIYDHRTDETLYAPRIPCATALGIVRLVEEMGYYIQLYPGKGYYCSEIRDCTRAYARQVHVSATPVGMPMAQWLAQNPSDMQKMLIIDTPEGADRMQAVLREAFPHGACYLKSKPHYLEIAPEGVDKGRSLDFLARRLGLQPDEVMAFGDGQNDVPMLRYAGAGYAMANACAQALACTPLVAPPSTEDGVAQVIESYIAQGKIGAMKR